jgi:hypothetical protein
LQGKPSFLRDRDRWTNYIEMDLEEIGREDADYLWIENVRGFL